MGTKVKEGRERDEESSEKEGYLRAASKAKEGEEIRHRRWLGWPVYTQCSLLDTRACDVCKVIVGDCGPNPFKQKRGIPRDKY